MVVTQIVDKVFVTESLAELVAKVRSNPYPVLRAFPFVTNVDGETDLQFSLFYQQQTRIFPQIILSSYTE